MTVVLHLLTSREALLESPAKRRAPEKLFHPTQPPRARREIVAVSLPAGCWHTSTPRPRAAVGRRDAAKKPLPQKKPLSVTSASCRTPNRWRGWWWVSRGCHGRSVASRPGARQRDGEKPSHHQLYPLMLFNQHLVLSCCCFLFLLLIGDKRLHCSFSQGRRRDLCDSSRKKKKKKSKILDVFPSANSQD